MTEAQWHRRADRYIAVMKAYQSRLEAQSSALDAALSIGLGECFRGELDPYREALRLSQAMKYTRSRMPRSGSRINLHHERMLSVWIPEERPS